MIREAGLVRAIPSARPRQETEAVLSRYQDWFYDFSFTNGAATRSPGEVVSRIHTTRAELIFPLLDEMYQGRWPQVSCLDVACHQGWFAMQVAARGARKVLGVDLRPEHVEMASAVCGVGQLNNVEFRQRNLYEIRPDREGEFDLTFFLGVLYHLDNPLEALRILRRVTRRVCVIETQVARPGPEFECLWGAGAPRKGPALALVASEPNHVEGGLACVLVPTLAALYQMLHAAGFPRLCLSVPTPEMHAQYVNYDRVVLFAQT